MSLVNRTYVYMAAAMVSPSSVSWEGRSGSEVRPELALRTLQILLALDPRDLRVSCPSPHEQSAYDKRIPFQGARLG